MIILGLNAFHGDSSAALVRDGRLIAAVEEERLRRIKHWAGFPSRAVAYCLDAAGVTLADVDAVAINQNSRANMLRKLIFVLSNRPKPGMVLDRLRNRKARADVRSLLENEFPNAEFRGRVHQIEHHMAHLSSAFHVSPFEEAAILSVDGFGDFSSAAWGVGRGTEISVDGRVHFPHSLGIFYQAMTQYLGFPHYGDEYKVMGLAPYGVPSEVGSMRKLVQLRDDGSFSLDLRYFRHHLETAANQWEGGPPSSPDLFTGAVEDLLGPRRDPSEPVGQRHMDIARSVQAMYEEAFFNLINVMQKRYGLRSLALAGGCAMNSVANGKIKRQSGFRNVYVQAAAGDAGGAIGAAFAVWHKTHTERSFHMDHAYWGPCYGEAELAGVVSGAQEALAAAGCAIETGLDAASLCQRTSAAIDGGSIVGWFQGRLEWGPRALGNRSILCDPRRSDVKAILNAKIKRRESFRPFAPSVLKEHVAEWFEEDDDVPFMMQVFQIREDKRRLVPAVTHVDGSGRLQTVTAAANPLYHALIEAFRRRTGVPMVLNTSFNENEPVVCHPKEALDCFLRTDMDVLVLGSTFIERRRA